MLRDHVENELKINDGEVKGVFIHPVYSYFVVLSSSGMVHLWSSITGVYERSLEYKEFEHLFGLKNFFGDYQTRYKDIHRYGGYKQEN